MRRKGFSELSGAFYPHPLTPVKGGASTSWGGGGLAPAGQKRTVSLQRAEIQLLTKRRASAAPPGCP